MHSIPCAAVALLVWAGGSALHAQSIVVSTSAGQPVTSINLSAAAGSTAPVTQALHITSSVATTPLNITVTSSASWLTATLTSASPFTPADFTISANPAGLPANTYPATLLIGAIGAATVPVQVTFTVGGAVSTSQLAASPASLNFSYQTGAGTPAPQTIDVSTASQSPVAYTITSSAAWLMAGGTNMAPGTLTVMVSPTGLAPGTYNGTITLSATSGGTSLPIAVTLTVASSPSLDVSPSSLTFYYQIGQSVPAQKNLTLSNTGSPMAFTVSAATSTGGNWLMLDRTGGTTPSTISAQLVPAVLASLAPGNYTGTIVISATGASNPVQSIPVSLTISVTPLLDVGPSSLTFNYQVGGAAPADQTVTINSTSTTPVPYSATASTNNTGNWLIVTPAIGLTPAALVVSAVPAGLGPGTYTGTITITSTMAGNSPVTVSVVLKISNDALLTVSPTSMVFNYQTGKATPPIQSLSVSSTSAALGFTISTNMVNTSSGINWLLTSVATSSTPATINVAVFPTGTGTALPPGTYTGSIVLTPTGTTTATPVTIPVTLNVSDKALINVNPPSLAFTYQAGAATPDAQGLALSSTGDDVLATVSFATTSGGAWLPAYTLNVNVTSATPFSLPVSVNPANMVPGVYRGTVTITPQNGNPATSVPVSLTITGGAIAASPTSLSFSQSSGGAAPASKMLSISSSSASAMTFSVVPNGVSGGVTWLSVTPAGGTALGTAPVPVTVSVNAGSLQPGTYTGNISVISVGAANSPLNIPVTLTVGPAVTLTVPAAPLAFSYQIGNAAPASQTLSLSSAGGPVQFTAQAAATSSGNWLSVTPTAGTTPANLTVSVNPANLAAGNYTGTITITSPGANNSPQAVNVTLAVAAMPVPAPQAVINVASSLAGPLAPGEIVSIYGTNLGPAVGVANTKTSGVVDTTLADTQVLFDNIPGPVLYASSTVINAVVPYRVAGRASISVQVVYKGANSAPMQFRVADAAPGISANAQGQAAVVHANGAYNGPSNPADKGSIVVFYGTGEGLTTPPGEDGRIIPLDGSLLKRPVQDWKVTIGGVPAEVLYIGSAPGFVSGAFQANVRVPADAPSGSAVPIVLTIGTSSSQGVANMAIR